jgi:hyperosmotically inducible protein
MPKLRPILPDESRLAANDARPTLLTSNEGKHIMRKTRPTFNALAAFAFVLTMGVSSVVYAESAGQYIDDATITAKVKAAILSDAQLKATQVSVQTSQGTVQLSGTVDNQMQESEALKVANQVDGVRSVKDLLNVRTTQVE